MKHSAKHVAEYIALRGFLGLIRVLPLRCALAIGWVIGSLFFFVFRYRRDKADARLLQVFGDRYTAKERRNIAWLSFRNICFNAVEAARFSKMTAEDIRKMPLFAAMEQVHELYNQRGSLIVATAHMGNWDLAGVASKLDGLPIFSIARRQKNPLTDGLLNEMRNATGMEVVLNDSRVLKNVVKNLKNDQVLAILPDVRSKTEALSIDFLGGKANLGAGTALFAQMANCPIIPVALTRHGWTEHHCQLFDPIVPDRSLDKKEEWHRMIQELMTIFDAEIRKDPTQYFWFNKRWVLDPIK